jgi:hypothetical protein
MKVRISRRTVISARCEAHVEVRSAANGLFQILHSTKPSAPAVSLASEIAEIRANVPFRVRVINPTRRAHTIFKGMVICLVVPVPARVLSLDSQEEKSLDRLAEVCFPTAALQLNNVLQETAQSTRVARTNISPKALRTQVRDKTASS